MTSKSVSESGLSALTIHRFDLHEARAEDTIGAAGSNVRLQANVHDSGDHVVSSLSRALSIVEREQDDHCAAALRRAIAARLAALQVETKTAGSAEGDTNRRSIRALQNWRLKRVVKYVDLNLSSKVGLLDLAAVAGLSRMHFASQFRVATGLRPHEFLLRRRIRRSKELLRTSPMSIVEIALAVGFLTQAHFTTVFKRFVGCTPRHWRMADEMPSVRQTVHAAPTEITAAL